MKKVTCCFLSTFISTWSRQLAVAILAFTVHSYANAEDITLLDPATLAVGTTLGEFLIVKESCPDPTKTDCLPTEKLKYVTAVAGRTGKIEFVVNIADNFELDVNVDWNESFEQQMITLFKANNENSLFVSFYYSGMNRMEAVEFDDSKRMNLAHGWQEGSVINNVELSAKNGAAYLHINGTPFKDNDGTEGDTVVLDPSQPYIKLVVGGLQEGDRLFEVKLKGGTGIGTVPSGGADFETGKQTGIQQCQTDPASCGITVTPTTGDFESGRQAGIQQCQTDPASCSITVTPNVDPNLCKQTVMQQCQLDPSSCGISITYNTGTNGTHATFNPCTRELYVPFVDVPGAFGVMQTYEVYMVQQPSTFTFDLDMNRIKVVQ